MEDTVEHALFTKVQDQLSAALKLRLRTSNPGGMLVSGLVRMRTPGIAYLSGAALRCFDDSWYDQIEAITRREPHLLTKTRADLEPEVEAGRVIIAIDTRSQNCVVGCIVLWHLCSDWFELGTYVVREDYRYKACGPNALPIGDALYHQLLHAHRDKNILGTTTNARAVHIGQRHGMQMVSFTKLPSEVRRASCICPTTKTGADNNWHCKILDQACRVRITRPTWIRMGRPQRLSYP